MAAFCAKLPMRRLLSPQATTAATPLLGSARSIVHKSILQLPENYPEPWDYKHKASAAIGLLYFQGYQYSDAPFDRTQDRLHQNSRLIVVEGNIASGKSSLARQLADQLGFHHMPEFRMDDVLIDRYGNDLRDFYHLRFRIPDVDMFYRNPMGELSAAMQERIFNCRFDQYLNALAHILNTGQGVVLERSPHSDFVFTNAMRAKNYVGLECTCAGLVMSRTVLRFYYYVRKHALPQLRFWPHLVVYLDAPVETCLQNIRKRGNANEIVAVDETYLKTIEESYKDSLREYRKHSKILAYDWTTPGDVDSVVEDIERMDFDFFEWHSGDVFEEWHAPTDEVSWNGWRQFVTQKTNARLYAFDGIECHDVGELYISPRDAGHFLQVMRQKVLKSPYSHGFIQKRGDEQAGLANWRMFSDLPEPWYEYYFREMWYSHYESLETSLDPHEEDYDPDYVHHHH